jgi:SET domain-containing protein
MPKLLYKRKKSGIQGHGLFARQFIKKGKTIIEYTGEHITEEEASRRYDDDTMERHHTFLFSVGDDEVIDAAVGGNDARFINHSCDPNCEAVQDGNRIFIVSIRKIREGEELTYDYQLEREDVPQESWTKLYACRCGSPKFRGTLLDVSTEAAA